jgi:hypothetical protein
MAKLLESAEAILSADRAASIILSREIARARPSLRALRIGFFVSYATTQLRAGKARKPPYFSCCYNVGNLGDVNIVAFYYPLIADWELMEKNANRYGMRVRSAIREEMIHSVQVMTIKRRYDRSIELRGLFRNAECYYEHLLGKIIDELATSAEGQELVCTAAQLYYEDWSITSIRQLRETDKKLHGRDGYLVSELIRQLVQIRFGELTSEEAKGRAWDRERVFDTKKFGTTENLLQFMAGMLRQAVPKLIGLSPTLAEALAEIERTIQKIEKITFEQTTPDEIHAPGFASDW